VTAARTLHARLQALERERTDRTPAHPLPVLIVQCGQSEAEARALAGLAPDAPAVIVEVRDARRPTANRAN